MPGREDFQYAVVRVVPHVERGECLNAGVVLYSRRHSFLGAKTALDEGALAAMAPDCEADGVRAHLQTLERVAAGAKDAGPIAALPRCVAAPRAAGSRKRRHDRHGAGDRRARAPCLSSWVA